MVYRFEANGDEHAVFFSPPMDDGDQENALADARTFPGFAKPARYTIMDWSAVEHFDFDPEAMHATIRRIRLSFARGGEYRYALVAPRGGIGELDAVFLTRDYLTVKPADGPQVRAFETLVQARAWASQAEWPSTSAT